MVRRGDTDITQRQTERVVLRDAVRILVFGAEEIRWIEAEGAYVKVHPTHGEAVVRESPGSLEARFGPWTFFRIHRSAIVNILHVRELRALSHGDRGLCLTNGAEN